ncbi:hypothetical protein FS935_12390 [Metabacillus litoralis]|uniref:YtxH domain-containing protein n=1 Tax=Metabacillus litoralis TaxID=152268 RepID=A0A5C6W1C3_9BACI|nr:hypothetical protein [Metabacillus litoralis]TXC90702.1 hypothetical protein FS935_12390 [Metabacillus litoralis]
MKQNTKKKVVASGVALSTIGVTSYVLKDQSRKDKLVETLKAVRNKIQNMFRDRDKEVIEKAGHPHPHDIEDNKMVSEGAAFSVNYYDEKEK